MFGYMGLILLVVLLFLGLPVYLSLALTGVLGLICIGSLDAAQATVTALAYQWGTNWVMICVPLFILMGEFAYHSGIGKELYEAAHRFLGHLRGGLAMSTVVACAAFGAMSGSSLANAGTFSIVSAPEMKRHGYDDALAAGSIAAGGTIGTMIPPSASFVVLGLITDVSIGKLFIAGVLPGILMTVVYMMTIWVFVKMKPKLAPSVPSFPWKERFATLAGLGPVIAIFVLVVGGMYIGFFSPTEAGAVGAFGTFVFLVLRRRITKTILVASLTDTLKTSAMIYVLWVGGTTFGNFLGLTALPRDLVAWIVSLPVFPNVILAAILFFYIPLGCFMDLFSAWMVTLPMFYPVVQSLGFDMIWFLVMMNLVGELGLITPPVGLNVFVVRQLTGIPMGRVFAGCVPFFIADVVVLVILWFFPPISLWLPSLM